MEFLLLLMILSSCSAVPEDMSGKMFSFPMQSNTAYVKLLISPQELTAMTVCQRTYTDLNRDHGLFSMATPTSFNEFLIMWDNGKKEIEIHVRDKNSEFKGWDYKRNMWHSICSTWDSVTGLVQLWFDGVPSIRKFAMSQPLVRGTPIVILGQEQDAHGGGFEAAQSFVGMVSDVHMWNYALSGCEIRRYSDEEYFTPGNVINWSALEYLTFEKVFIKEKSAMCYQPQGSAT